MRICCPLNYIIYERKGIPVLDGALQWTSEILEADCPNLIHAVLGDPQIHDGLRAVIGVLIKD